MRYFCTAFDGKARALSSVGSERLPYKQRVGGSTPSAPTREKSSIYQTISPQEGRLAQLVQSVCLTSRGSGVRLPQRPPKKRPVTDILRQVFFFYSVCSLYLHIYNLLRFEKLFLEVCAEVNYFRGMLETCQFASQFATLQAYKTVG